MGHREDLLIGAKRCLIELGYGRTTARDIVKASGANLASIGYHYGSKEALLNQALMAAISESGDELISVSSASTASDLSPLERFEDIWTRLITHFPNYRQVWVASFEALAQADHAPVVRQALADGIEQGREGITSVFDDAGLLKNLTGPLSDSDKRALGSFYQALFMGVMAQLLVDPDRAPSGSDIANALRILSTISSEPVSDQPHAVAS
ncbi:MULTISPECIES: TetR/AcrR family transcriptional regulator [unclassified Streptomyces]|uniref:TetR/AcrR family transcriptional regulator n=1 Tax=unclassified Streptomyces TaxID=2593676 RepID=UPI0004C6B6FE|nr:TetR/AcrR family transcriptional regulator [Streptomyces sp. NRRL F-2747]